MTYLNWEARFDLGIRDMDHEHQGLIQAMNQLYDLHESGADFAALRSVLSKLERLTIEHFRHEEEYLASISFPGLTVHRKIHERLLEQLGEHKAAFEKDGKSLSREFFSFLKLWLSGHIAGVDQKYAAYSRGEKQPTL